MKKKLIGTLFAFLLILSLSLIAQDKEARITLSFEKHDSLYVCKAHVSSNDSAAKDAGVKLFVQRMYSLLPIGRSVATNEEGISNFNFPKDIPADRNGKLTVVAKIEDDENYANTETKAEIDWGVARANSD